jgi:CheY-like chemotaxis protein/DNA-binding XRE family transcriptional regulator
MAHELQVRLGAAIKAHRRQLGVTQEELAWRADLHRTYLADIERGSRNITLRSVANLARALETSVESLLSAASLAGKTGGMGEVLLVEDNADDAELTLRAFRQANFSNPIKVVKTGREALDYLLCRGRYAGRHPLAPQLVLLDLNLPDLSGQEVLKEIKSHRATKHLPVVVLTISRDDRNIIECGRLGADNYIIKPVDFQNFSKITPKLNLHWALVASAGAARRTSKSKK